MPKSPTVEYLSTYCDRLLQQLKQVNDSNTPSVPLKEIDATWETGQIIDFSEKGNFDQYSHVDWHRAETNFRWCSGQNSRFGFRHPPKQSQILAIYAHPFGSFQRAYVYVNNMMIGSFQLTFASRKLLLIPYSVISRTDSNFHTLTIRAPEAKRPQAAGNEQDQRLLAIAVSKMQLLNSDDL